MFGKDSIYGQAIVHLDDKKRIILPRFTGASQGDRLILVRNNNYLSIHSEVNFERKIKELESRYEKSSGAEKIQIDIQLLEIYKSILKKLKCDKERRVTLGNIIEGNEIECIGAREYLILNAKLK